MKIDRGALIASITATIVMVVLLLMLRPYGPHSKESNVLLNWQRYGLINLNGAFVMTAHPLNEDDLGSAPRFRGHSPTTLYGTYALWKLTHGTLRLAVALNALLLTVTLIAATLWAFPPGRTRSARLMPLALLLSPAIWICLLSTDPVATAPTYALIAFLAFAGTLIRHCRPWVIGCTLLLLMFSTTLNWNVCIPVAIWGTALLLMLPEIPGSRRWQTIGAYAAVAALSALVLGVLIADKFAQAETLTGQASAYLHGSRGYSHAGANMRHFLRRTAVVTVVGLAPLWCMLFSAQKETPQRSLWWRARAAVPLGMAAVACLGLANYAAHAQWAVAGPIVAHGLLAALFVTLSPAKATTKKTARGHILSAVMYGICLPCSILFALTLRVNEAGLAAVNALIRFHTQPGDIVYVDPVVPGHGRVEESGHLYDLSLWVTRPCYTNGSIVAAPALSTSSRRFLMTTLRSARKAPVADSGMYRKDSPPMLQSALSYYRTRISRKTESSRLWWDTPYLLYAIPTNRLDDIERTVP